MTRLALCLGACSCLAQQPQQETFVIAGSPVTLSDVTSQTAVYFTSMRFNLALSQWNVDVVVSNQASTALSGPMVLVVDSSTGTSGLMGADGTNNGKAFVNLTAELPQNALNGGQVSSKRTVALGYTGGAPALTTSVFAMLPAPSGVEFGFVRTLDGLGQPLPSVTIYQTGPDGEVTNQTDPAFGVATVGGATGNYSWQFCAPGYLPVWRQQTLTTNIQKIFSPRLTSRNTNAISVNPLGGSVTNTGISIAFPPGAVSSNQNVTLTPLTAQTLPALLPVGWSPLQAFWLESRGGFSVPPTATLQLWGPLNSGDSVALAQWNPQTLAWQAQQLITGTTGSVLSVTLPGSGAYAVVVADLAPNVPPAPALGQALLSGPLPLPDASTLSATGSVNPGTSAASSNPALVTGSASITLAPTNGATELPSGLQLECDVREEYTVSSGLAPVTPEYEQTICAYQRPGTNPVTLQATFPMRPLQIVDPAVLEDTFVTVGVLAPTEFSGTLLTTNGGSITSSNVELIAGAGIVASPQCLLLRSLAPTNFSGLAGGLPVLDAFEVAVSGISPRQSLSLQVTNGPTNALLVVARVLQQPGQYGLGLQPVARLISDSSGNFTSLETNADQLPGIGTSGQYLLIQVGQPQTLVAGIAENTQGQPAGGLLVGLGPWATFSTSPNGQFLLIAPGGTNRLTVSNPTTGDTGNSPLVIAAGLGETTASIGTITSTLQIVSVSPEPGTNMVALDADITLTFNGAVTSASLSTNGIELLDASNDIVSAQLSLDPAGTTATLIPNSQLLPATTYTIIAATNINDSLGRTLQGPNQFVFTTIPNSTRSAAGQLVLYQPGATNVPSELLEQVPEYVPGTSNVMVVHGTAGAADPGVPVIIINQSLGTTTTVISNPDGSFVAIIQGSESDLISATLVALNGTQINLPAVEQLYDDGSVGLYQQGGTVAATGDGGPIQMTVPPNALQGLTKFKLTSVNVAELSTQLNNVMPSNGVVAGSALNLSISGTPPTLPVQFSFPVDLSTLDYPTNEAGTNACAAVAVVADTQDVTSFRILDQLVFAPQASSAVSPLIAKSRGARPKGAGGGTPLVGGGAALAGALDTSTGLLIGSLGSAGLAAQIGFNQVLVPLLFGARPVTIKGSVSAVPIAIAEQLQEAGVANDIFNFNPGQIASSAGASNSTVQGFQTLKIPLQLAQAMGLARGNVLGNGVLGSIAGAVASLSIQALALQEHNIATPLSGAFITVSLANGPVVNVPGQIIPGMVYATSGEDGTFLTVAPAAGANYIAQCTHPLYNQILQNPVAPISAFPGQQGQLSLAGAVYEQFFFQLANPNEVTPTAQIGIQPVRPAAGQPCTIVVTATQPTGPPNIGVNVTSVGQTSLIDGQPVHANWTLNPQGQAGTTNTSAVSSQWTGVLTCDQPVLVTLKVVVQDPNSGNGTTIPYQIGFGGPIPPTPSYIPPPPTNDVNGPVVIETDPPNNGFIGENNTMTVIFNKPIDTLVTNHLAGINLNSVGTSLTSPITPVVQLSPNQQELTLEFPGLPPSTTYQLTLTSQSIQDLAGNPLNQQPSSKTPVSFSTTFRTIADPVATIPSSTLASGRGVVISGTKMYALDQAPQGNYLDSFDITDPLQPVLINQYPLVGAPRDLVLVPQYHYKRNAQDTVQTNDLVAVVGGDLDALINQAAGTTVSEPGQYLWVFNMGDPANPVLLASPYVTFDVGSAVTKIIWAEPYLVYQTFGSDIQSLGFVNLQEMIFGYGSSLAAQYAFGPGRPGVDVNHDGEYVDPVPGEQIPIPPTYPPGGFFGLDYSLVLQGTTQQILDYSVTPFANTVGVTLSDGVLLDTNGVPDGPAVPPMYRTFVSSGQFMNVSSPTDSMYALPNAYPRWVTVLDALQLPINGTMTTIAAALISQQPDANGNQSLALLNISLPESPTLVSTITIPATLLGGNIESVWQRADGMLEVDGQQNVVVLNPQLLTVTNVPPGQLPPAIVDVVPGAGGIQRSQGTTSFGVHAVADNGKVEVIESPPQMQWVSFPSSTNELVDPTTLNAMGDVALQQIFQGMIPLSGLAPANIDTNGGLLASDLEPPNGAPNPALHYYVLMYAPGGYANNNEIDLGVESLSPSGRPFSNLGVGFAPVRAISDFAQGGIGQTPRPGCGAPIRALPAFRVSNNPNSVYYNWWLSRPLALITEGAALNDLTRLQEDSGIAAGREILFSGANLRAFIDPDETTNAILGSFAGQIDYVRQVIYPVSVVEALTVNRGYLPGANPPPPGGSTPMEDTYGTIQAHSGELRTCAPDISLPSPRMPINIIRSIGNQDTYEGPFGVGWDFNYNQRLTILDPLTFPQGLALPMILRDTTSDSEIAGSQDVLFHSGDGRDWHFTWAGNTMPDGYTQDPLVQQFDYQDLVSDYYLPQHGMFDLLVKYKDGRFERLTPGGMRYRYRSDGRLETILDSYPNNRHDLTYDANNSDLLRRIDDHSVPGPRYLQFGYYLRQGSDPSFTPGLDMNTSDSWQEGKICQLVDYTGRNVLYNYTSDGFLTNCLGVLVNGENGGYAGRSHTFYSYTDCRLSQIARSVNGVPLVSAVNAMNAAGAPVAMATTGSHGNNQISVPLNNSAANVASETTSVTMGDGTSVQRQFDKFGNVTSTMISGSNGAPATQVSLKDLDGRVYFVQYPMGNTETMGYDTNNPILRSRGNLLSVTVDPGPRGGPSYTRTMKYDPRFNLPSGPQVNANGFTINLGLTSDGRAIQTIDYGGGVTKTMSFNANGQLTDSVDENGVEHSVNYDPTTAFTTSESLGDFTYDYGYDGSIPSQLGEPASISPPQSDPTTFVYNNMLQAVQVARGDLVGLSAYDEVGRVIYHQDQLGDNKQLTTIKSYDENDFMTNMVEQGVEVNGVETSISTSYKPDARLRIQTIIHPTGAVQTFAYDNQGNLLQTTLGDYTQSFQYDLNNNVTAVMEGGDLVREYQYDGLNRATNAIRKIASGDFIETRSFYNGGELAGSTVTDPQFGVVRQTSYDQIDALGRDLSITYHGGVISPQYTYSWGSLSSTVTGPRMSTTTTWDTAGHQTSRTDPDLTVNAQFDANGRTKEVDSQEMGATYSLFFTYDNLDHQISLADLLGTKFTYTPRADGNYVQVIDALNNITTLDHSSLGELLSKQRADGMQVDYRHDPERQMLYQGDPGAGFNYGYDASLRLTNSTLRNGAIVGFGGFDPRNMPTSIAIPGGSETLTYDLQRELLQRKVTYLSNAWEEDYTYDAAGQVRSETYVQNGGGANTATYNYDPAGPLLSAKFSEDNATFTVGYGYYSDGTRQSVTYPSGVTVTETRDSTGLLTGVSDANGNIIQATAWQGNREPKSVLIGSTIGVANVYDVRGRLTGSRATRLGGNSVLAHLRYQYDAMNNIQVRQFIHRGGKADHLAFDNGERLSQAQISTVPLAGGGFATPYYGLTYNYNASGLDYLTSTTIATNLAPNSLVFATNWSAQDDFLLPEIVDGFNRGPADPKGNVAQALLWVRPDGASAPQAMPATLEHDGLGRLVGVTRADGVSIRNEYQPNGLRFSRQVSQNGQLLSYSAYVYDNSGRLLEEYDRTGQQPVLIGRYYYASGDTPVAADLLNPATQQLERYYYLKDASQSVLAIADTNGVVVERAKYDSFGQPTIEERNSNPPRLAQIVDAGSGSLLIAFSEPVWTATADPGPGGGIVQYPPLPTNAITVSLSSTNVPGTCQWLPYLSGYPPYSVVEFTPSQPLAGPSPAGFVGWWPASGTTADVQGGHNGTLRGGATYGPGLVGQAFLLNGNNAYVQVPDAPALDFNTNDFTACLWVNFNNTAGEQVLIEKWNDAGPAGWSFIKRPGGNLRLAMSNGTGGEVDVDSGALNIPNTNWIHYAVRRQAGQISIFTNGVSVASGIDVANLSAATPLLFGSRGGTNYFLNGSIDEVTLYSRALSDAEITAVAGGVSDPGPVSVSVTGGALADEWGNTNLAENVSFEVYDQTGLVYFAAEAEPSMGAVTVARSALNSPFLFQGQYFDYDTGLLYMRARFYDPYSGMFFEPDAKGYEFSVNHYAGLANNPVSLRDPTGLVPTRFGTREEQAESFFNGLEREGHANADEVAIMNREYPRMAKLGFTDLETSAIVSSAYRNYMRMNRSFDLGVRAWRNPEAREISASKGFQEKIEAITGKTGPDALIEFAGVMYVSDIDAGWSSVNGVPSHVDEHARFTETVNDLMRDRTGIWRESRESYGMDLVEAGPQTPFPHGASLTLPQQYGMAHALSPGGTFGIEAFEHVAEKMPNGLGDCFAFKFDPRSGLYITEHVDVASQVRLHEAFFKDNLINPNSPYYDQAMASRVRDQVIRDGRAPALWLPESFYGKGLK